MELMHNTALSIVEGPDAGIYRIVLDEIQLGKTAVIRLDPPTDDRKRKGGRKRIEKTKRPRKLPKTEMLGELIWFDRVDLLGMAEDDQLIADTLTRAVAAKITWPLLPEIDDAELEHRLFPPVMATAAMSKVEPDWATTHQELKGKGATLPVLHEEYLKAHPWWNVLQPGCRRNAKLGCNFDTRRTDGFLSLWLAALGGNAQEGTKAVQRPHLPIANWH